jgi:hypothetical protein
MDKGRKGGALKRVPPIKQEAIALVRVSDDEKCLSKEWETAEAAKTKDIKPFELLKAKRQKRRQTRSTSSFKK